MAPETDQASRLVSPSVMETGEAVKAVMAGRARTVTVAEAVVEPAALVAVRV
ncbi:MAG: hypothetical protein IPL96_16985 [Holophagaceae bacterium]|nr:hypothetical protein [Holophagaceae bacterium]